MLNLNYFESTPQNKRKLVTGGDRMEALVLSPRNVPVLYDQ